MWFDFEIHGGTIKIVYIFDGGGVFSKSRHYFNNFDFIFWHITFDQKCFVTEDRLLKYVVYFQSQFSNDLRRTNTMVVIFNYFNIARVDIILKQIEVKFSRQVVGCVKPGRPNIWFLILPAPWQTGYCQGANR